MTSIRRHNRGFRSFLRLAVLGAVLVSLLAPLCAVSQEITPEMLEEAARRTGMSKEQLLQQYQLQTGETATPDTVETQAPGEPPPGGSTMPDSGGTPM